jgi:hypothetical protein
MDDGDGRRCDCASYLGRMAKHFYAGILLEEGGFSLVLVGVCSGGVGYYEEFCAWVGCAEFLEFLLGSVRHHLA